MHTCYLTVSLGLEHGYGLARSSSSGSLTRLQSKSWPRQEWEESTSKFIHWPLAGLSSLWAIRLEVSVPCWLLAKCNSHFPATWAFPQDSLQYGSWLPQSEQGGEGITDFGKIMSEGISFQRERITWKPGYQEVAITGDPLKRLITSLPFW